MEYTKLGKTNISISRIGIGTWQWGETLWGYGKEYALRDLVRAFVKAVDLGINFFDTAEIYGKGRSEVILGRLIRKYGNDDIVVATKVWPTRMSEKSIRRALQASLKRLGLEKIGLYYIHWPNPLANMKRLSGTMLKLLEEGYINAIGVSNFDAKKMIKFDEYTGGRLSANQVRYSLLYRKPEQGLLSEAKKRNITVVAYSPLDQGALLGKYREDRLPKDMARSINPFFTRRGMKRISRLKRIVFMLAEDYGVKPVNIVLRYVIEHGAVPLVGVRKPSHVEDLALTFDFRLKTSDLKLLERTASEVKLPIMAYFEVPVRAISSFFYNKL